MVPIAYGRTDALRGAPGDKAGAGMDPRLKPAAHDFEATMLQELLKPMANDPLFSTDNSDGDGLMTGDASMSSWSSLGAQSLAKAISEAGGLGIATQVIAEVEAEAQRAQGAARRGTQNPPGSAAQSRTAAEVHSGPSARHAQRMQPLSAEKLRAETAGRPMA